MTTRKHAARMALENPPPVVIAADIAFVPGVSGLPHEASMYACMIVARDVDGLLQLIRCGIDCWLGWCGCWSHRNGRLGCLRCNVWRDALAAFEQAVFVPDRAPASLPLLAAAVAKVVLAEAAKRKQC